MTGETWVLLTYRLPREPSTPRIALWRALRRLGAVQLVDGTVALPEDERTREQFDWLADHVVEGGGEATVWVAQPGGREQARRLAQRMADAADAEYAAVIAAAKAAAGADPVEHRRTVAKLRRELRSIGRRDYFPSGERDRAVDAVGALSASLREVPA